jgi:hypothetical protein
LIGGIGPVDDGEKLGSLFGAFHREALPVAAEPQIGEQAGGVLMEMQKCLAVEYPRPTRIPLGVDVALPPAPRIGEHGAAILAEIGIDPAAIAHLCEENVLLIPKAS